MNTKENDLHSVVYGISNELIEALGNFFIWYEFNHLADVRFLKHPFKCTCLINLDWILKVHKMGSALKVNLFISLNKLSYMTEVISFCL